MKKIYTSVILSALLVLPVTTLFKPLYPVFAEELSTEEIREKALERRDKLASKSAEKKKALRTKLDEKKEKMASREAALKQKLDSFRDKKKASLVEKINTRLVQINTKSTTHFNSILEKMNQIARKLETKIAEEKTNGSDTTSAENALSEAKAAILAAQTAVTSQTEKSYIIVVNTEAKVSEDARLAKTNLQNDLKTTHDLMVTARQSLAKAISTASSTLGGENNGSNE